MLECLRAHQHAPPGEKSSGLIEADMVRGEYSPGIVYPPGEKSSGLIEAGGVQGRLVAPKGVLRGRNPPASLKLGAEQCAVQPDVVVSSGGEILRPH